MIELGARCRSTTSHPPRQLTEAEIRILPERKSFIGGPGRVERQTIGQPRQILDRSEANAYLRSRVLNRPADP